ncbi:hypothetical protein ACQP2F_15780 [Actinoplanes sp. CA-030573]|uniref:hypothetical protein n=1 Tax=Actinoplanes sp. CA-030573 TaxID=3239898 RepID=UPI003D9002EA
MLGALGDVVSGQPKYALRGIDLGLQHWIIGAEHRALLLWLRGEIQWRKLKDPKSGLIDLIAATADAHEAWQAALQVAVVDCRAAAAASRKRTRAFDPAPTSWTEGRPVPDIPLDLPVESYPRLIRASFNPAARSER